MYLLRRFINVFGTVWMYCTLRVASTVLPSVSTTWSRPLVQMYISLPTSPNRYTLYRMIHYCLKKFIFTGFSIAGENWACQFCQVVEILISPIIHSSCLPSSSRRRTKVLCPMSICDILSGLKCMYSSTGFAKTLCQ